MQVAATLDCESCVGIEVDEIQFNHSRAFEDKFKSFMRFLGKSHSDFEILNADVLNEKIRTLISLSKYFNLKIKFYHCK